ncbi:hypothetical protein ACF0H5_006094 [Mactra antiquata]
MWSHTGTYTYLCRADYENDDDDDDGNGDDGDGDDNDDSDEGDDDYNCGNADDHGDGDDDDDSDEDGDNNKKSRNVNNKHFQDFFGTEVLRFYYQRFYKVTTVHFFFSCISAALFVLGLIYSSGSDGEHDTPYFIPAIVLAALHFAYVLWTFRMWMISRNPNYLWRVQSADRLYTVILKLAFAWGVIGSILTGSSGVCANENPCYYTVNEDKNFAVAISIIVILCLNCVFILLMWCSTRTEEPVNVSKPIKTYTNNEDSNRYIGEITPAMLKRRDEKKVKLNADTPSYPRTRPNLHRVHSDIKGNKFSLPALTITPIQRRSSRALQHDDQSSVSSSDISSNPPTMYSHTSGEIIKPLPPNKNKEKFSMMVKTIGRVNIWYKNSKRRKINTLPDNSNTVNSATNDTNNRHKKQKLKRRRTDDILVKRPSKDSMPLSPPPAYHTIVTYNDQQAPYLVPGLPSDDYTRQHVVLSSDIYTGTAYPDNVPVVAKPKQSHVMRWTSDL